MQSDGKIVIAAEMELSALTEGVKQMRQMLDTLRVFSEGQFRTIGTTAAAQMNAVAKQMPTIAQNMIIGLSGALTNGRSTVGAAAKTVMNSALDGAQSGVSGFRSIGTQAVHGIISGVNSASSSLYQTMRSLANQMVATLQASLKIQSPSRVMQDEVGYRIGEGIAAGILDAQTTVNAAVSTVSSGVQTTGTNRMNVLAGARSILQGQAMTQYENASRTARASQTMISGTQRETAHAAVSGNTFIFNKPVETPYAHAKQIKQTMEAMLYGT